MSALRAVQVRSVVESEALRSSSFDERNPTGFVSPDYPAERLAARCLPLPADERARKREALLAATEAGLERIAHEAARRTRMPLDAAHVGRGVGRTVPRYEMLRHFQREG